MVDTFAREKNRNPRFVVGIITIKTFAISAIDRRKKKVPHNLFLNRWTWWQIAPILFLFFFLRMHKYHNHILTLIYKCIVYMLFLLCCCYCCVCRFWEAISAKCCCLVYVSKYLSRTICFAALTSWKIRSSYSGISFLSSPSRVVTHFSRARYTVFFTIFISANSLNIRNWD